MTTNTDSVLYVPSGAASSSSERNNMNEDTIGPIHSFKILGTTNGTKKVIRTVVGTVNDAVKAAEVAFATGKYSYVSAEEV